jgi:hypothetical protein
MRCPNCGKEAFSAKAGTACGWCGTLKAGSHTLESFFKTLTPAEDDEFWGCATGLENPWGPYFMFAARAIVGRFGVNPYAPGTSQWSEWEREWMKNSPEKMRHQ